MPNIVLAHFAGSSVHAAGQPDMTITREFLAETNAGAAARDFLPEPNEDTAARRFMKTTLAIALALFAFASTARAEEPSASDLSIARSFWRLHSLAHGFEEPTDPLLEEGARKLIRYCADTPAAQMPRSMLQDCEDFDGMRAGRVPQWLVDATDRLLEQRRALSSSTRDHHNDDTTRAKGGFHDPGAIDLCPPPHKMTRDGCL